MQRWLIGQEHSLFFQRIKFDPQHSQPSVTSGTWDLMPSSGLLGHHTQIWYPDTHTGEISIYTKQTNKVLKPGFEVEILIQKVTAQNAAAQL